MRAAFIRRMVVLAILILVFIFIENMSLIKKPLIKSIPADSTNKEPIQVRSSRQNKMDLEYLMFLVRHSFSKTDNLTYSGFNETLSHSIPLNRSPKINRDKMCIGRDWRIKPTVRVSVVIPLVNEPWSTLFRTIVSILLKSPMDYIEEVILVDDHSDRDFLQDTLFQVLSPFSYMIRLIRTPFRMGPAASRNYGARHSKGNVLVFLDSHCEVYTEWLEPLLEVISQDPSRIVVPGLDVIPGETLQWQSATDEGRVQMTWTLGASFGFYPPHNRKKYNITDPIPQISLMGAVFLVDAEFFFKMGGLGDYFWGWGGEDVELALKYWLCGGGIVKCVCSRVAHVYKSHPYKPTNNARENVAMIAEVWLDEFLPIFKCTRFNMKNIDRSAINATLALKKNLKCRPFRWYLENVFPEMEVPEPDTTFIKPKLRSQNKYLIVTQDKMTPKFGHLLEPSACSVAIVKDRVKCKGTCLTVSGSKLAFEACRERSENQMWTFADSRLQTHTNNTLCIGLGADSNLGLVNCKTGITQMDFETEFSPNCIKAPQSSPLS